MSILATGGSGFIGSTFIHRLFHDRAGADGRFILDDTKLRSLGWQPRTAFADGLRDTIAWLRNQQDVNA